MATATERAVLVRQRPQVQGVLRIGASSVVLKKNDPPKRAVEM